MESRIRFGEEEFIISGLLYNPYIVNKILHNGEEYRIESIMDEISSVTSVSIENCWSQHSLLIRTVQLIKL